MSTAGTFGSQRCSTRISTIPAIPTDGRGGDRLAVGQTPGEAGDLADQALGV